MSKNSGQDGDVVLIPFGLRNSSFLRHWVLRHSSFVIRHSSADVKFKVALSNYLRGSCSVLMDFSGISPVSNETCTIVAIMDTLQLPGETESGSAGTQPDEGYPGLRCANGASDPCRLTLSGVVSWMPLDIGAMPQKIQT